MTRMLLHILYGIFIASVILPLVNAEQRDRLISYWCRGLLAILNIRVVTKGVLPDAKVKNTLFVANHVSWVDIHALNSVRTLRFVAKSEIRGWPVFGWLSAKANTLFIERTKRLDASRVVDLAADCLRNGDCLCFFPEGGTSDGTELRPFKGSLLQAAIDAEAQLWPLSIRYPRPDGSANTAMAYYDDVSMAQSIKQVLSQRAPVVELHFFAPIATHGRNRRHLSLQVQHIIAAALNLPARRIPETLDDPANAAQ